MAKKAEQEEAASRGVCFYICPIGEKGGEERKRADSVFKHVISPAAEDHHLDPVRADNIGEPGFITKQIIERLLASEIVVADFWHHNPNVFYELAIRHATRKPVIHLYKEPIPFHVEPMRAIFLDHQDPESWEDAKLEVHVEMDKALQPDFDQWTPITVAIDLEKRHAGGSDMERRLAEMYSMLETILGRLEDRAVAERVRLPSGQPFAPPGQAFALSGQPFGPLSGPSGGRLGYLEDPDGVIFRSLMESIRKGRPREGEEPEQPTEPPQE